MKHAILLLCGLSVFAITPPPNAAFFSQIVDGGYWKSKIILRNTTTTSKRFRLEFRDAEGRQLPFTFTDGRSNWYIEDTVFSLGTFILDTPGIDSLTKQGWVRISTIDCGSFDGGTNCGAGVFGLTGTLLFQHTTPGRPPFEATVPLDNNAESFSMPFDNTQGYVTSIAVLNPFATTGQRIRLTFRDLTGGVVAQSFIDLGPRKQQALETTKIKEAIDKRGTLTISSDSGSSIVVLGLLFNPAGAFSTMLPFSDN